ncbi:MAG: HAD family hydrolase [Lachnospiraceae bacterium]|nr:HAD family hydrolase [Lachnospiraceae bacterium]
MEEKKAAEKTYRAKAALPLTYDNYVFDLYGTLVDICTHEDDPVLWQKLALFYGYYDALYEPEELKEAYARLVSGREAAMKKQLGNDAKYAHEASPEIELTEVFRELFTLKGGPADTDLAVHAGQFFRVLSTDYVRTYPGTRTMLQGLKEEGKKIYLLSNAQRIFTAYEMHVLDIADYFDGILISSDYQTRKPDPRFFEQLFIRFGLKAEKTLFVGNDSHSDIAGARTVGFDTFYICSNISPQGDSAPEATYSVDDFGEWTRG